MGRGTAGRLRGARPGARPGVRLDALRQRSEGGYALLTVLVATMIFGLMVLSLLSLVGTDARVQPTYLMSDSMKRAVDGALQTGVAQVKAVPSSELKNSIDPCVSFDLTSLQIEDRTVDLTCEPNATADPMLIPTTGDGDVALTTIGKLPTRSTLRNILTSPNAEGGAGLEPWFADLLLNIANITDAVSPGLIHVGPNPLTVLGDVNVNEMYLGFTPSGNPQSPLDGSMYVHGEFRQQRNVDKACINPNWWVGGFAQYGHIWDTVLFPTAPKRAGNVVSLAPNGTSQPASLTCAAPATAPPAVTLASTAGLTDISLAGRSCTPGTIHEFEPGRYGPAAVAVLNLWFAGLCPNSVYWFKPGVYSFEAGTATSPDVWVFNDPTSSYVFGTWRGAASWVPGASALCDPSEPGVAIELGSTTSFDHSRGDLSMCGDPASDPSPTPVLHQTNPLNSGSVRWASWPGRTGACPRGTDGVFDCATNFQSMTKLADTSTAAPASFPTSSVGAAWVGTENPASASAAREDVLGCTGWPGCGPNYPVWRFDQWAQAMPDGQDVRLGSAQLKIRGWTFQTALGSRFWAEVTNAKGSCVALADAVPPLPSGGNDLTINLLTPGCRSVVSSSGDLANAEILVKAEMSLAWPNQYYTFALDAAWLELALATPLHNATMNRAAGANHATFSAFGVTHLPYSNMTAVWGDALGATIDRDLPFWIGHVVTNMLISGTREGEDWRIGTLASRGVGAGGRQVTLKASVDGRLLASVNVTSKDVNASNVFTPATQFETSNWAYCNKPLTANATCAQ